MNTVQIRKFAKQYPDFHTNMVNLAQGDDNDTITIGSMTFTLVSNTRVNSETIVLIKDQSGNFYRFHGHYDSYEGTDYYGIESHIEGVKPKEKIITVYNTW